MQPGLNIVHPFIMHIDLNSCFATIEQQANPFFRGKPLVVAAYDSPNGCVLSPSIEAKKYGIKTGMRVKEAQELCPYSLIIRTPDTIMIRDVNDKFMRIFADYSPSVIPKSIDEAILDFHPVSHLLTKPLTEVAQEIKNRLRKEIGEWISCSVGISTNRLLAKLAAFLHKPDGLDIIDHHNLRQTFSRIKLTDFCGINTRYQIRLNSWGIYTPLQFLDAPLEKLQKQVFKSINGYYWYHQLRGWEITTEQSPQKTFGQDYALQKATDDVSELSRLLMKLCEKMGRRLRESGNTAHGIHLALLYKDFFFWHKGNKLNHQLYTTYELFTAIMDLFHQRPKRDVVRKLMVRCYDLVPRNNNQPMLFETNDDKMRKVSETLDFVNDRFGEFTITPAIMMKMENTILDRIAFGKIDKTLTKG